MAYTPPTHEQPKSDLREFADDLRTFWEKFGFAVLVTVLIVLVVLLMSRYLSGRQERQREAAYAALAEARNPFEMDDVAEDFSHVPGFAGYARLHAADLRAREAMGLMPAGDDNANNPDEKTAQADRAKGLDQAAELYQRVIEQGESSLQVLNARMGLASVLESQGKFDEAARQYNEAQKQAGDQWPVIAARAKARAASLDEIRTPVEFPPPKPKEQAEAAPPADAAEGETNIPINPDAPLDLTPQAKPQAPPQNGAEPPKP